MLDKLILWYKNTASGVNKKPFACENHSEQFQNRDRQFYCFSHLIQFQKITRYRRHWNNWNGFFIQSFPTERYVECGQKLVDVFSQFQSNQAIQNNQLEWNVQVLRRRLGRTISCPSIFLGNSPILLLQIYLLHDPYQLRFWNRQISGRWTNAFFSS